MTAAIIAYVVIGCVAGLVSARRTPYYADEPLAMHGAMFVAVAAMWPLIVLGWAVRLGRDV